MQAVYLERKRAVDPRVQRLERETDNALAGLMLVASLQAQLGRTQLAEEYEAAHELVRSLRLGA